MTHPRTLGRSSHSRMSTSEGRMQACVTGDSGAGGVTTPDEVAPDNLVMWLRADQGLATGGGRELNGLTQEFNGADATVHDFGAVDWTISGHFRLDTLADLQGIVGKWSATEAEYRLIYDNGGGAFTLSVSTTGSTVAATATHTVTPVADTWYHFVIKHEAGVEIRLKIDEVEVTEPYTATLNTGSELFAVGTFSNSNFLNGRVSKFNIWTRLTTDAEDTSLYNNGRGKFFWELSAAEKVGHVSNYDFNEDSGNAIDKGSGGDDLTAVNAPTATTDPSVFIAIDSSAVANHGMLTNFSSGRESDAWETDVPSAIGTGRSLNFIQANTEYIDNGTNPLTTGNDFTMSCWLKTDLSAETYVGGTGNPTNVGGIGLRFLIRTTGQIEYFINNGSGTHVTLLAGAGSITADTWHHTAFVADRDGNATIYIDNVLKDTEDISGETGSLGTNDWFVGKYGASALYFNGNIDDVRLYGRALTAAEITALHTNSNAPTPDLMHLTLDDGPEVGTLSDTDPIVKWISIDGNNKSFSQSTAAARPVYTASAINSLPGVTGDGTDDILLMVEDYLTTEVGVVFLVFKSTSNGLRDYMLCASNTAFDDEFFGIGEITSSRFGSEWNNNLGTAENVEHIDGVSTNAHILMVASNDTSTEVQQDAIRKTESEPNGDSGNWFGTLPTVSNLALFGRQDATPDGFYPGIICEVLIYDADLTVIQKAQIHDYLADRYAITIGP